LRNLGGTRSWTIARDESDDILRVYHDDLEANTRLVINRSGLVGIGTTTPDQRLSVGEGDGGFEGRISLDPGDSSDATPYIRMHRWTGSGNSYYPVHLANDAGDLKIRTGSAAAVGAESVSDVVTIKSGGNVGIGITNPQLKLDVAGAIGVNGATAIDSSGTAQKSYYAP
jgi:hypothetical protein